MPLIKTYERDQSKIAIWKTEEDADFFRNSLSTDVLKYMRLENFTNESKQLEQLSSRHLLQTIIGETQMKRFRKSESGMPFIEEGQVYISLSHTKEHSAVIVSNKGLCGIDVETVHPRVLKIADKFVGKNERQLITDDRETEMLMLLWSAKETVYKLYARKEIDFKEHIFLSDLQFTSDYAGQLKALLKNNFVSLGMNVEFEFFDGQILTYAVMYATSMTE